MALAASLISAVLAAAAVVAWRTRPDQGGSGAAVDIPAICGAAGPGSVESSTVRAVAAAGGKGGARLVAGHLHDDAATPAVLESVRREFPGFDAVAVAAMPDQRRVIEPALVAAALAASDGDPVMILAPWVRPSAHALRRLAASVPGDRILTALPGRSGDSGLFSAQADIVRMTPLYYMLFGPVGVIPTVAVAPRGAVVAMFGDPLSFNVMSAGTALHRASAREGFVPVDVAVSFGELPARAHLAALSRIGGLKFAACCVALCAAPLSLMAVTAGIFQGGGLFWLGLPAMAFSICARAAALLTWRPRGEGPAGRMLEAIGSPLLDASAFAGSIAAALSRSVSFGRTRYDLHRGGLLSSGRWRDDESGGRP